MIGCFAMFGANDGGGSEKDTGIGGFKILAFVRGGGAIEFLLLFPLLLLLLFSPLLILRSC